MIIFFFTWSTTVSLMCLMCPLYVRLPLCLAALLHQKSKQSNIVEGTKKKNSLNKFHKHHFCLVSNYFCGRFEKNRVTQRNPERCSLFKHICTGTVSAYFLHICSIFNIWTFINSLLQNAKLSEGRFSYIRSTLCSTYVTNVINTLKHTQ